MPTASAEISGRSTFESFMQDLYRNRCSASAKLLIDEIESFVGLGIEVSQGSENPFNHPGPPCPRIGFPNLEEIADHFMLHELLHLSRNWPERVPLICTRSDTDPLSIYVSRLDNDLEHLSIVPRTQKLCKTDASEWPDIIMRDWKTGTWDKYTDCRHARRLLLQCSLTADFLLPPEAENSWTFIKDVIRKKGLTAKATEFSSAIREARGSKSRVAAIAFHFLELPPKDSCLVTMDRNADEWQVIEPIPNF